MKKVFLFFSYCLINVANIRADAMDDLKKSIEFLSKYENLTFKVDVKMYAKVQDKIPQMSAICNSVKKGKNYYANFMGRTTIYNYQTMEILEISDPTKTMIYSEIPRDSKIDTVNLNLGNNKAQSIFKFDTTSVAGGKASYKLNNDKVIVIELKPGKESPYKSMQFTIDKKNMQFRRLEYFLKGDEKSQSMEYIDIEYSFNSNAKISDDIFNIKKYVTKKGDTISPKKAYLNYKVKKQLAPNNKK
jgi:outer membrane lipoprotein-sorting protein